MENFFHDFDIVKQSWWPYIIAFVVGLIGVIRAYIGGVTCPSQAKVDGKIVVITGGSGGIGLMTAKELVKRGACVVLAIRNAEKGKEALKSIKEICPDIKAIVKMLDLADFASVRDFATQMKLEFNRIDILINNAGIIFHPYIKTVDGNELTMSVNYFGPFLLTHLLLPLLNKSEEGRVINLSAMAHTKGKINLQDLNSEMQYRDVEAFAQSKLALTMFTRQMATLVKQTNIIFLSVNPGLVRNTGHLRKSRLMESFVTKLSVWPWMWLFMKTPRQGSQSVIFAAVEPILKKYSGSYISNCEIQPPSEAVKDTRTAEKLYKKTCGIVGIDGDEIVSSLTEEEEIASEI